MPIFVVSADAYPIGRRIAEKTAAALGYRYIDREILEGIAAKHDIPEERLNRLLDAATPPAQIFKKNWRRQLALIQEATLDKLLADHVVCHGLSAHLYVLGVSHAIRVRIISTTDKAAGASQIDAKQLEQLCRQWSLKAFDMDQTDPAQYDTVIRLAETNEDQAVRTLTAMSDDSRFRANTFSVNSLKDLELSSRVRSQLLKDYTNIKVEAHKGTIIVRTRVSRRNRNKVIEDIKIKAGNIEGVSFVEVHAVSGLLARL